MLELGTLLDPEWPVFNGILIHVSICNTILWISEISYIVTFLFVLKIFQYFPCGSRNVEVNHWIKYYSLAQFHFEFSKNNDEQSAIMFSYPITEKILWGEHDWMDVKKSVQGGFIMIISITGLKYWMTTLILSFYCWWKKNLLEALHPLQDNPVQEVHHQVKENLLQPIFGWCWIPPKF